MELQNSYILLYKYKDNEENTSNINNDEETRIVLSTKEDNPIEDYFAECFAEIKEVEKTSGFYAKYKCRLKKDKNFNVIIILKNIKADYYIDVIVSGKTRERIIHKMELIHSSLNKTKISEEKTFIVSYDCISEYYTNKMSAVLNELERKLRKLLYIIYTAYYRDEYIEYTFVDNASSMTKEQVIPKFKKQADKSDKRTLEQRFFDEFEYQHYNHLLFFPKWTSEYIQNKEDISPQTDWERFYSGKVKNSDSAKELILEIKKHRNKVAHYKSISKGDYTKFMRSADELFTIINDAMNITTTNEFFEQFKKRFFDSWNEAMKKMTKIFTENIVNLLGNALNINMFNDFELESEDNDNG